MENYFVATFALGLSYFIGYSFMESVNSIFEAKRMEDDLKKCNDNAEKKYKFTISLPYLVMLHKYL